MECLNYEHFYKFYRMIDKTKTNPDYKYSTNEALRLAGRLAMNAEDYLSSDVASSAVHLERLKQSLMEYNQYMLDEVRNRPVGVLCSD